LAFIYPAAVASAWRRLPMQQLSIYKTNKQTATPACSGSIALAFYGRPNTHTCVVRIAQIEGVEWASTDDNLMVDNLGLFSAACVSDAADEKAY
jgi:hypothetical protein